MEVTLKENDIVPSHKRNIFHLRSYIFHLIYCPARVSQQMAARDHGRMLKDKRSNNCDRIYFLSDPSPIIGYACHSLTDSLTDCCLVNLIDVTLACEDANSKLVEVVTVAHVDDKKRVDNSLVQIWKVKFGLKVKFLFKL